MGLAASAWVGGQFPQPNAMLKFVKLGGIVHLTSSMAGIFVARRLVPSDNSGMVVVVGSLYLLQGKLYVLCARSVCKLPDVGALG